MALLGLAACAGQRPQIKVLGVSEAARPLERRTLVMFVEVVNPTGRDLRFSRMEYRFDASSVDSKGQVALSRAVRAGSSAMIEIPVPLNGSVEHVDDYKLVGRLFARSNQVEQSWKVEAAGVLPKRVVQVRLKVADAE